MSQKISSPGLLKKGTCYKKASDDTYLGKYKRMESEQSYGVGHVYAIFEEGSIEVVERDKSKLLTNNVIEVGCPVPVLQQQWISHSQLTIGKCYVNQDNVYLGKFTGTTNAFYSKDQYTIIHMFQHLVLAGMNWSFWEVPCQAGGKRSSRSGKRSSLYGKRSSRSGKRKTRKH